jgi:HD superfamily phosphohydrolase
MARMYPDQHFHHEDWSVDMLRHMLKANHIRIEDYGLNSQDQLFIEEIIRGTKEKDRRGRPFEKFYLYDIVNNSRSGLDVDKLDYFRRDIRYTNVDVNSSDFQRFFENARVLRAQPIPTKGEANTQQQLTPPASLKVTTFASPPLFSFINATSTNDSVVAKAEARNTPPTFSKTPSAHAYMICFPEKMINESISLFALRYQLHQKVYTHKSVKKVEYMVSDLDILSAAQLIYKYCIP